MALDRGMSESELPGRLIAGRYRLAVAIGRGSMGQVWRARDELLDRDVALKEILFPRYFDEAERNELRRRQLREARSAARLSHPAVATVFDVVEELGHPWIVMEFVRGQSLDRVLREQGPLPPQVVARIGQDLLAALAAAHAVGVLHRDVKPGNVMLTDAGGAVLTDFGVATIEGDPLLTHGGVAMGTTAFAAPERLRDAPDTPAADLWSLGMTLYAASDGQAPYEACGSITSTIAAIATEDPAPPTNAGPNTAAIMALLSRDPAARPTAQAATRMLAGAAIAPQAAPAIPSALTTKALTGPYRAESSGDPSAADTGLAAGGSAVPGPPDHKRRRGRLVMAAVAALVVLLGGSLWAVHQLVSQPSSRSALQSQAGIASSPVEQEFPATVGHHKPASTTGATPSPRSTGQVRVTHQAVPSKQPSAPATTAAPTPTASVPAPGGCGTLTGGHTLADGQSLPSCNGVYKLGLQDDGNLVLYNNASTAVWYTATMNENPLVVKATMLSDGNFVLSNSAGTSVWDTGTSSSGAYLDVGNDGYVRIYSASGSVLWTSVVDG